MGVAQEEVTAGASGEVAQAVVMQSGRGCRCSEERSSVLRCGWPGTQTPMSRSPGK
jgi:hypothetical protein